MGLAGFDLARDLGERGLVRHREIGQAYTLDLGFQLNRHVHLRAYYLHHSAGDAIRDAGGKPVDFGMAALTLRF